MCVRENQLRAGRTEKAFDLRLVLQGSCIKLFRHFGRQPAQQEETCPPGGTGPQIAGPHIGRRFSLQRLKCLIGVACLAQHSIKLSKLHLSSALKVKPTALARAALASFVDHTYLHQVIVRQADGKCVIYRDLDDALAMEPALGEASAGNDAARTPEWRIHFHVPLHSPPTPLFDNTTDHLLGVLDSLQVNPGLCSHLEMETYTWEVLPRELKDLDVVEQLVAEYEWTLARLAERGLAARREAGVRVSLPQHSSPEAASPSLT